MLRPQRAPGLDERLGGRAVQVADGRAGDTGRATATPRRRPTPPRPAGGQITDASEAGTTEGLEFAKESAVMLSG